MKDVIYVKDVETGSGHASETAVLLDMLGNTI